MKILPDLLSTDQTSFLPGRSTDTNIHKVFTHLQLPPVDSTSRVLAVLDIAFDSVAWSYMFTVLEHMGFGQEFLN